MVPQRYHYFTREGVNLAVDPSSLILYKLEPQSHRPWAGKRYQPISIATPSNRQLDEERNRIYEKSQLSSGYCYLNISHDCNMKCAYCFASGGAYGASEGLMSKELARKAVDWILQSSTGKQIALNLFGGEPLVNASTTYDTIEYAITKCQELNRNLSIILSTNGTIDLIQIEEMLQSIHHWIAVSIDGGPAIQNINRPFSNGEGSYDVIAQNIRKYIVRFGPSKISARATWRRFQSQLVQPVMDLIALGTRNVYIGRATAFGKDLHQSEHINDVRDFDEMLTAYDILGTWYANILNDGQRIIVQPMQSIMSTILKSNIRRYRCTAGFNKWCIVPDGNVYPCHRFVGDEKFIIGHVSCASSAGILPPDLKNTALPESCDECWVRYWCDSDNCTYLGAIKQDLRRQDGFCDHMRSFIEMACFHVARLSEGGRETLLTT